MSSGLGQQGQTSQSPEANEQTPLKPQSSAHEAGLIQRERPQVVFDELDQPSFASIPSERCGIELTNPEKHQQNPLQVIGISSAPTAPTALASQYPVAMGENLTNRVEDPKAVTVEVNTAPQTQPNRDVEYPQVLMTLPDEPAPPGVVLTLPEAQVHPIRLDFKQAMTWGERLLYYKCMRRIDAYNQVSQVAGPRAQMLALLEWTADTTYLLSKDDASIQLNMVASTYAKAITESHEVEFPGDIPIHSTIATISHLHQKLVQRVAEFRSRDPYSYKPTENWFKRAWPDVDFDWTKEQSLQTEVGSYYYHKYLDSSLAHRLNMEWMFFQLVLWIAITLIREAAAEKKGSPVPLSGGDHLPGAVLPVLVLFGVVRGLAHTKYMWKYLIRGAWLAYSIWFSFATTMDDLKYLVAPIILIIVMYVLNWKKVVLRVWVTYLIGVVFMLVTFIIYLATKAPITWKNFLLMFYLYNTWIAIHLDVVLAKLLRRFTSKNENLGRYDFMSWYTYTTGFLFHFLTIALVVVLGFLGALGLVCLGLYCWQSAEYEAAQREQVVHFIDDPQGRNRAEAQRQLDRQVEHAREVLKTAPALIACLIFLMTILFTLLAFILVCILVPSPCMFREKIVKPITQRYDLLDEDSKRRLIFCQAFMQNYLAEERAFREANQN